MKNQPIGLLDSGIGGLSVVKKVIELMPAENIVFVADQARLPYGDRPVGDIINFTWQMVRFLLSQNVKAIIFACNTATAAALDEIAPQLEIPVIGVIQSGSLAASEATHNNHIGVIGTNSTINSHAYREKIALRNSAIQVSELGTPKFVPLIESLDTILPTNQIIIDSLQAFSNSDIDTLILGCTHYPFIADQIQLNLPDGVQLIDPADQTANYTRKVLNQNKILRNGTVGFRKYYTTGEPVHFANVAQNWLADTTITASKITLTNL